MPGADGRETREYGLAIGAIVAAVALARPFGYVFAAIPVAVYATRGDRAKTAVLLAVAAGAGGLGAGAADGALAGIVCASLGLVVAFGLIRAWRYGTIVVVTAALACAIEFGMMAGQWETMDAWARESHEELTALIEGPDAAEFEAQGRMQRLKWAQWLYGHWLEIVPGLSVATVLMGMCVIVSTAGWWLRRSGAAFVSAGSFRTMRPPDWLVWSLIAVALMWFADRRWPSETLRVVSWNGAAALSGVYWLNGLSVLFYGLSVLKPAPIMTAAIVMAMVFLNVASLLPVVGLFDAWGDFRRKFDALAAARKMKEDSHDDTA